MIWGEAEIGEVADLTVYRTSVDEARPDGLHLSQIRDDLVRSTFPDLYPDRGDPGPDRARMEVGEAWEDLLETALLARYEAHTDAYGYRPDPIQLDGVWMSPDRVVVDEHGHLVEEHKATWYSSRHGITRETFWGWWIQIASYMWALETERGRFRVFWVNNDYKPPRPRPRTYDVRIPAEVLKSNWMMVLAHARRRGWL